MTESTWVSVLGLLFVINFGNISALDLIKLRGDIVRQIEETPENSVGGDSASGGDAAARDNDTLVGVYSDGQGGPTKIEGVDEDFSALAGNDTDEPPQPKQQGRWIYTRPRPLPGGACIQYVSLGMALLGYKPQCNSPPPPPPYYPPPSPPYYPPPAPPPPPPPPAPTPAPTPPPKPAPPPSTAAPPKSSSCPPWANAC